MKTNITLKIEADLLREARILAAEEGISISAMLAAGLEPVVRERKGYHQARRGALTRLRKGFRPAWDALILQAAASSGAVCPLLRRHGKRRTLWGGSGC